jgi:hypothetical protein
LTIFQLPLVEKQNRCERQRSVRHSIHLNRRRTEKATVSENSHQVCMAGIAQGLFLQVGDIHSFTQGADSVGIECFQRADPTKVDKNKEKD